MNFVRLLQTRFEVAAPLEQGEDVVFQGKGTVQNKNVIYGHGEDDDVVSSIKPEILEVRKDQQGIVAPPITTTSQPASKSPSRRLRDILYIYFTMSHPTGVQFDKWYESWIDRKIQQVQESIDEMQGFEQ